MIRAAYAVSGTPTLLIAGERAAFVDRDWLQGLTDGVIAALAIDADGQLHYRDRQVGGKDGSPEREAAAIMSAFVEDLLAAVMDADRRYVEVTGGGLVAAELRGRLAAAPRGEEPPSVVVELTGRQAELLRATRELAPGGLLVLAGESAAGIDLDVYADVHRRGLQVLGVPLPVSGRRDRPEGTLPEPVPVRSGEPLPPGLWYCVTA